MKLSYRASAVTMAAAASIATVFAVQPADALTINLIERTNGQGFDLNGTPISGTAGNAPVLTGTGTLASVMNAAADYWEAIIGDAGTLNIQFGWTALSGGTLGQATQFVQPRDFSGAGKFGVIKFDNDGSSLFFADDDPSTAETFGPLQESKADLGGGEMSIGVSYGSGTGEAAGRFDLFSTAIHEIGHLLGLADLNQPGDPNFAGGQLNITQGMFSGASLDLTAAGGGHLDPNSFPIALMQPFTNGDRRLASDADIAAIAQLSGFSNIDYTANKFTTPPPPPPATVPLPAAGLMLIGGLGGLGFVTRRRRKA